MVVSVTKFTLQYLVTIFPICQSLIKLNLFCPIYSCSSWRIDSTIIHPHDHWVPFGLWFWLELSHCSSFWLITFQVKRIYKKNMEIKKVSASNFCWKLLKIGGALNSGLIRNLNITPWPWGLGGHPSIKKLSILRS